MSLLDEYLNEGTHEVNGIPCYGTASRIAMVKSGKTSVKNKSLEDIQASVNNIFNSIRLSAGTDNAVQAGVRKSIAENISEHKSFLKELEEKYNSMSNTDRGLIKKYILAIKSVIKIENKYLSNTSDVKPNLTNRTKDDIHKDLLQIKRQYISEYTDTKLNIYEAYDNGYITEDEKIDLLNMLETQYLCGFPVNYKYAK